MAQPEKIDFIDSDNQFEDSFSAIRSHKLIAVHCDGENLCRAGTLTILTLKTSDQVYVFDVLKLGLSVFEDGLKDILEDVAIVKLMFDCREDSDALWHHFKVKVTNVLDLQLLQILYEREHPNEKPQRMKEIEQKIQMHSMKSLQERQANQRTRIRGLINCIEWYLPSELSLLKKKKVKSEIGKADPKATSKRPLIVGMRINAAADVQALFPLYQKFEGGLDDAAIGRVTRASTRYAAHNRDKEVRTEDMYERNNLLPMYILEEPPAASAALYECEGCKHRFPAGDFSASGVGMKCPVCRTKDYVEERDKKRRQGMRFSRF